MGRKKNGTLAALGLKRRMQTVYHPVSPDTAGLIFDVKELVGVEEVEGRLSKGEMREQRKPEPGYWVEKRASER